MTDFGGPTQHDDPDLESRLHDAFDEARRIELPAGFFEGWPEALPSRRRVVRGPSAPVAVVLGVAASLVIAVALVLRPSTAPPGTTPSLSPGPSSSASPSLPPGVVAWIDATPVPSPTPSETSTAGLPVCSSDALELRFAGWGGMTGGALSGGVVMSEPDPSAARCLLSGVPAVSILDSHGRTMDVNIGPVPSPSSVAVVLEPGLPLPPEHEALLVGQAGFSVFWSNWCGPDAGSSGTLVVRLPDAGTHRLAIGLEAPTCVSPGDPSTMTVAPTEAPEPSPPPWTDLTASVDAPSVAIAGEPFRYFVTLRNGGDQPVALDPCTIYVERLWSGNDLVADPRYLLNCAAVSAIEPGASTTFEMILEIPADAPPGPAILLWTTDGPGPAGPKLPITIEPPGSAVGSVAPATLAWFALAVIAFRGAYAAEHSFRVRRAHRGSRARGADVGPLGPPRRSGPDNRGRSLRRPAASCRARWSHRDDRPTAR
jgi:hypothetical protein